MKIGHGSIPIDEDWCVALPSERDPYSHGGRRLADAAFPTSDCEHKRVWERPS
jgi:hypothetical protein